MMDFVDPVQHWVMQEPMEKIKKQILSKQAHDKLPN